ncbi:FK506-binding nuclear protein, partial [Phenoliferia sp. Uapishka_3]
MALILGLWSVVLEPGKTYSQTLTPAITITNISFGAEVKGNARSVVTIKYPEFEQESDDESEDDEEESEEPIKLPKLITKEAVIAILKPDVTEQVSVNISLVEDVEVVEFAVSGPNAVHLVGHYVRQEDFDQDPYSDSDGEDGEFDSDDESIDSDMMGDESMEGMSGLIAGGDDSSDDPKRFTEIKEVLKEAKKAAAANPKKRAAEDEAVAASLVSDDVADASMSSTLSKNQKKKLAKKLKGPDGAAAAAPEEKKVEKKEKAAVPEKKENKVEASPAKKEGPKPVTLAGGLIILDSKKGDGAVAKSGKKVGMRYIGKLDNGKIFDSNTKGSPLVFTLGRGEVIKGWDLGVAGMAVGGERKLTIPAAMAYGKKGTQGIPGNATLHFGESPSFTRYPGSATHLALTTDVKLVTLK